eukprot:scaffold8105_cov112-Isochrysis_galbana.AAC.1
MARVAGASPSLSPMRYGECSRIDWKSRASDWNRRSYGSVSTSGRGSRSTAVSRSTAKTFSPARSSRVSTAYRAALTMKKSRDANSSDPPARPRP